MNRIISSVILLLFINIAAKAQDAGDFNVGIKAGLNFTTIFRPKEKDSQGASIESGAALTRFIIGPTFKYAITDRNGLMLEVLYVQKGGRYIYDGESYYLLTQQGSATTFFFDGNRTETININNGYLDIPLMFYYKTNDNLSLYAGGYVGFLLNSTGDGSLSFNANERTFNGVNTNLTNFNITLDYNYNTDEPGQSTENSVDNQVFNLNSAGQPEAFGSFTYPSEYGAYYEYDEGINRGQEGNFFNPLDIGLVAGLNFRFDTGLVFGLRGAYGLTDVTNNFYDNSKVTTVDPATGNYAPISRSDKDVNFGVQVHVGFEF